jgi:hypothetical protein
MVTVCHSFTGVLPYQGHCVPQDYPFLSKPPQAEGRLVDRRSTMVDLWGAAVNACVPNALNQRLTTCGVLWGLFVRQLDSWMQARDVVARICKTLRITETKPFSIYEVAK